MAPKLGPDGSWAALALSGSFPFITVWRVMGNSSRPATMADVARRAGVSHQTVSRVLNDSSAVSPQTRETVLEAVTFLEYRRNLSARALVTQRSRTIGVIVAESSFLGPNQASGAIQTAARERGYAALVAAIRDVSHAEVTQVLELLLDHAVEGIAVIAPQPSLVEELREIARRTPLVLIADGVEASEGVHSVSVDQHYGARIATGHLIGLGHSSIAHVRGPQPWFDALEREKGWRTALADAQLAVPDMITGDWSSESGYQAGVQLLSTGLPDAVFCSNDYMALGVMAAFADQGVRVPADVSVIGYDDVAGTAHYQPPLTTVRQPFQELGAECVTVLLDAIAGHAINQRRIKPSLVLRRSTAEAS